MKAAVCHDAGEALVVEDLTLEPPQAGELRVQVGACAICQSDLHYMSGAWTHKSFPVVCGHEVAGTVVEVGKGAGQGKGTAGEGDRVIVSLIRECGTCRDCRAGRPYLCATALPMDREPRLRNPAGERVFQGLRTAGFAEFVVVHESQVAAIPDDLPFDQAGLLACGVLTGVGAVLNTAQVEPGASVAVIGIGGVGINCIQGAALAGAEPVIAIDLEPAKFPLAEALGATHALDAAGGNLEEAVREITGGLGADYVFVAAGSGPAMEQGAGLLGKAGCLVLVALPPSGVDVRLQPRLLVNQNQTVMGCKMGAARLSDDVPRLVRMVREGRLKLAELIAARYPLGDINEAIASAGRGAAARNVIVF